MRRKTFDLLASVGGILIVAMLLMADALATWGYSVSDSSMHN